uniref:DUF7059 domain-containing protein n=1 Tax=Cellulosimicrobium cellulans TaxID=1710 RepID=UPI000AA2F851
MPPSTRIPSAAPTSTPPPGTGWDAVPLAAALDGLRDDLTAAGFTVDGVEERLGPVASAALHREQAVPARRVLRRARPGDAPSPASGGA